MITKTKKQNHPTGLCQSMILCQETLWRAQGSACGTVHETGYCSETPLSLLICVLLLAKFFCQLFHVDNAVESIKIAFADLGFLAIRVAQRGDDHIARAHI